MMPLHQVLVVAFSHTSRQLHLCTAPPHMGLTVNTPMLVIKLNGLGRNHVQQALHILVLIL